MRLERHTAFGRRVSVCLDPYAAGAEEPWLVVQELWDDGRYSRCILSRHASYMGALVAAEGEGGAA